MTRPVSELITADKIRPGDHLVSLGEGTVEVLKVRDHGDRITIRTTNRTFTLPATTKLRRRLTDRRINMRPDIRRTS